MNQVQGLSLHVPARAMFVSLVTRFIQNGAQAFELGEQETSALTLAVENVFAYLCEFAAPNQTINVLCANHNYCLSATFDIPAQGLNLQSFNLTHSGLSHPNSNSTETRLLRAVHAVDHFHVDRPDEQKLRLTLIKEKNYPVLQTQPLSPPQSFHLSIIREPDSEEIKLLVQFINQACSSETLPAFLHYPGKLVDMIGIRDCHAAIAISAKKEIGGAILWRWAGRKTVECFGPYVFGKSESDIANLLLEYCLGAIAKTHAVCLINRLPTTDLPLEHFETLGTLMNFERDEITRGKGKRARARSLGTITEFQRDGTAFEQIVYFRYLHEDEGSMMWAHPALEPFLRQEYARHILPREIAIVKNEQETQVASSALALDIDYSQNQATLRAMYAGKDLHENLKTHVELFQKEKLSNIFFELDLGQSWQVVFTPALLECGFTPRLVLPSEGKGDVVLFQWSGVGT